MYAVVKTTVILSADSVLTKTLMYTFVITMRMQEKKQCVFLFLISFFVLFLGFGVFNVSSVESAGRATISLSPKFPKPGDVVVAKLTLYGFNRSSAYVTWIVNGEIVSQAYGEDRYSFVAGEVGSKITVGFIVQDTAGSKASGETTAQVSDLTIVWEGKTYTPLFYKGRSMFSGGADVVVSAVPSIVDSKGVFYGKDELIYSWTVGGPTNSPSVSGLGQHTAVLKNTRLFDPFIVYLQVSDPKGNLRSAEQIRIPFTQPVLQLYEDSPYVGVYYGRAVGPTYGVYSGREATVVAEPYHIIASSRVDPILTYEWLIGNKKYTSPGSISFGAEGPGYGSTPLSLTVKSEESLMQSARIDKTIDFGERGMWEQTNKETLPL